MVRGDGGRRAVVGDRPPQLDPASDQAQHVAPSSSSSAGLCRVRAFVGALRTFDANLLLLRQSRGAVPALSRHTHSVGVMQHVVGMVRVARRQGHLMLLLLLLVVHLLLLLKLMMLMMMILILMLLLLLLLLLIELLVMLCVNVLLQLLLMLNVGLLLVL